MTRQDLDLSRHPLLERMLADMESAPEHYRPTNFWASGLSQIVEDIATLGIETFRSHPSARSMFVPDYTNGRPGVAQAGSALKRLPVGRQLAERLIENLPRAEADYRVLRAADTPGAPEIADVSESSIGHPVGQVTFDGRDYSRSMLNYLRGVAFLKKTVDTSDVRRVLEIGGGYATMGEIFTAARPDAVYIDIDIPPVAYAATWYLQQLLGSESVATYDEFAAGETMTVDELGAKYRSAVLCPWQFEQLSGTVDLFVNFISFQEMEPAVVQNYALQVNRFQPRYLLLRNANEGKTVADVGEIGVETPTLRDDYLKFFTDYDLVASDSMVFGDKRPGFTSEAMILERRS